MKRLHQVTNQDDFAKFLTDTREKVEYNKEVFSKEKTGKTIKIRANDELVYEVYPEKNLLIVLKALYMTFHRDPFWGVAHLANLDEVLADAGTLIRI